jgi:hypothetical protein
MDGFVAGVVIGAAVVWIAVISAGIIPRYHDAKDACESELPRDKVCVMTFVEGE